MPTSHHDREDADWMIPHREFIDSLCDALPLPVPDSIRRSLHGILDDVYARAWADADEELKLTDQLRAVLGPIIRDALDTELQQPPVNRLTYGKLAARATFTEKLAEANQDERGRCTGLIRIGGTSQLRPPRNGEPVRIVGAIGATGRIDQHLHATHHPSRECMLITLVGGGTIYARCDELRLTEPGDDVAPMERPADGLFDRRPHPPADHAPEVKLPGFRGGAIPPRHYIEKDEPEIYRPMNPLIDRLTREALTLPITPVKLHLHTALDPADMRDSPLDGVPQQVSFTDKPVPTDVERIIVHDASTGEVVLDRITDAMMQPIEPGPGEPTNLLPSPLLGIVHADDCDLIGDHPGKRCRRISSDT